MTWSENFWQVYVRGDRTEAVRQALRSHEEYNDESQRFLLNYIDALVYGNYGVAFTANLRLQELLNENDIEKKRALTFDAFVLQGAYYGLYEGGGFFFKNIEKLYRAEQEKELFEDHGAFGKGFFYDQYCFSQNIVRFLREKRALGRFLEMEHRPYLPMSYQGRAQGCVSEGLALFYMKVWDMDWHSFLRPFQGHDLLFIFYSLSDLWHCLQFKAVLESLLEEKHGLLVLTAYAHEQLHLQDLFTSEKVYAIGEEESGFTDLIAQCLRSKKGELWQETEASDALYSVGRRAAEVKRGQQLGKNGLLSHDFTLSSSYWWEKHQSGRLPRDKTTLHHFIKGQEVSIKRKLGEQQGKIKVAHVVQRLTDFVYAPTKRLLTLLKYYPQDLWELSVYVTEQHRFRKNEYPYYFSHDEGSLVRGKEAIKAFEKLGIRVFVESVEESFLQAAKKIVQDMKNEKIEIAVIHDESLLGTLIAQMTDVPITLFFTHGVLPHIDVYEGLIQAFGEESQGVYTNPLAYDIECEWVETRPVKQTLGFSEETILLGTVSNMLNERLSVPMCEAVSQILLRCPDAHYLPIGDVSDPELILRIFRSYNVEDRVTFLSHLRDPGYYIKAYDLYLHEFPLGGALAVLEAMAAQCPVLSLYDKDASYKAKEGGQYFGIERTVKTAEEYIEKACELVHNKEQRNEWAAYAYARYCSFGTEEDYAKRHQNILKRVMYEHRAPVRVY